MQLGQSFGTSTCNLFGCRKLASQQAKLKDYFFPSSESWIATITRGSWATELI